MSCQGGVPDARHTQSQRALRPANNFTNAGSSPAKSLNCVPQDVFSRSTVKQGGGHARASGFSHTGHFAGHLGGDSSFDTRTYSNLGTFSRAAE
jgi:hypothetical protein